MTSTIDRPGQETLEALPECFDSNAGGVTIGGIAWLRVFSACQGLMCPTKFYRYTHKHCRQVIEEELGFCPKGKPGTAKEGKHYKGFRDGGKAAIYMWLGIDALVHDRECTNSIGGPDVTTIWFS